MTAKTRSVRLKVVLPAAVLICGVMVSNLAAVFLVTTQVSERYFALVLSNHSVRVQKIIDEAIADLVSANLLSKVDVVDASKKMALDRLKAYWSAEQLDGLVVTDEGSVVSAKAGGFPLPMTHIKKTGMFTVHHGLSMSHGYVTALPVWGWRIVTLSRPTSLLGGNTIVVFLIPLVVVSALVLIWGMLLILNRNLQRPVTIVLDGIAAGRLIPCTGVAEIDAIGASINQAVAVLKRRNEQLRMLHDIALQLQQISSLDEALRNVLEKTAAILGVSHAAIWVFRPADGSVSLFLKTGSCCPAEGILPACQELIGRIRHGGSPLMVNDLPGSPEREKLMSGCAVNFDSILTYPLRSAKGHGDVVLFFANKAGRFDEADRQLVAALAADLLTALESYHESEELRRSEEHYRTLAEGARDLIFEVDTDGRIVYGNATAMTYFGSTSEKAVGRRLSDFLPETPPFALGEQISAVMTSGESRSTELLCGLPVGDVWLGVRLFPLKSGQAGSDRVLGIARDITTAKRNESALKQSMENLERQNLRLQELDRLKDGLIRDVSHELKTPVAKQAMQLELLRSSLGGSCLVSAGNIIEVMEESIRRQETVIRNLLDLSRLEAGGRRYTPKPIRVDEVVQRVIDDYRVSMESHSLDLETSLQPLTVRGDEDMLWHILSNLINNAIKFRKKDLAGRITVTVRPEAKDAEIRVADDGIGLSAEELPKVFDRFYQASAAVEGSGVGLTICKRMVEEMGGSVSLESEGRGRGTTAVVRLPLF